MGISKKFLYYQYCKSAGILKILSILRSWGGCKISPKTAKNSEIFGTTLNGPRAINFCRTETLAI